MARQKQYQILGCALVLMAAVAFLSATLRTDSLLQNNKQKDDFGSAEVAFEVACREIKDSFSTVESDPVSILPLFQATLQSKSKIWTINGYVSCPPHFNKSYHWTVILSYDYPQEWEILSTRITPDSTNKPVGPSALPQSFQEWHGLS